MYWLFFAVGFTDEGLQALHDLISTGNPDFNDPVFWYHYIVAPVNTITEEIIRMLPSCVKMIMRSPVNRKAHQLWRYKTAMSYIRIVVNFGNPRNLHNQHMNSETQPYLHAMVRNKKYGRAQYEQSNKGDKNTYVVGPMRAFLISFPEKFKEWSDQTIRRNEQKLELDPAHFQQLDTSVDTSDMPCDARINPSAVWKSYLPKGVFKEDANYDIPSNWDAYEVFSLMNKGDHGMANFSTTTLRQILEENEKANAPRTPTPKKRKKRGEKSASYTNLEGNSLAAWDLHETGKWFIAIDSVLPL